jgi:hypothetical protein
VTFITADSTTIKSSAAIAQIATRPLKEDIMRTSGSKNQKNPVTASPPADLAKLGQDLLAQQRAIHEAIPDFVMPHPSHARLTGMPARVTAAAVTEGLAACTTHPALAGAIDAAEVQYRQDYETAFLELRDEMLKTFEGLDYSIRLKRHQNGQAVLRVLAFARNLVKSPENAGLKVHIEALRKGFRRRRPAPETPAPPPAAQLIAPTDEIPAGETPTE